MPQKSITAGDVEFRLRVTETLARLETIATATDARLIKLNGSVASHEERLLSLRDVLSEHRFTCPMRSELATLRTALTADETATKVTAEWWLRISPLIWTAVGGAIILFLSHADVLLRAFAKP